MDTASQEPCSFVPVHCSREHPFIASTLGGSDKQLSTLRHPPARGRMWQTVKRGPPAQCYRVRYKGEQATRSAGRRRVVRAWAPFRPRLPPFGVLSLASQDANI